MMACKYFDQSHEMAWACKVKGDVCLDWLNWYENNKRRVACGDDFCINVPDDFDPEIFDCVGNREIRCKRSMQNKNS